MSAILNNTQGYRSQKLFELENPPIYLARNPRSERDDMTLVTLKTLEGLVSEFQIDERVGDRITGFTIKSPYDLFYTDNTQTAAKLVAEGKATYCITNQSGLDRYNF